MRDFLFLRHGETDWNRENRLQGQIQGVPLNERGRRQAADAASFLVRHSFDLIVSSTLDRAVQTAQIIASKKQLPLVFDQRLIERDCGPAEGKTCADVGVKNMSEFFASNPEGVETKEHLEDRASAAVADLLSRHAGKRMLLVAHAAWLRALAGRLAGIEIRFPNAIPFAATADGDAWNITRLS